LAYIVKLVYCFYSICSVLQEKVYPSRIAKVDEIEKAPDRRVRTLWPVDRECSYRQVAALSLVFVWAGHTLSTNFNKYINSAIFVIYLPEVIKLMESW